jgi:hypothetical protein
LERVHPADGTTSDVRLGTFGAFFWFVENMMEIDVHGVLDRIVGDMKVTPTLLKRVLKITPVPGGVGPVTVATLLAALVSLAKAHHQWARRQAALIRAR